MKINKFMMMAAGLICCGSVMAAEEYSFATPEAWQNPALLEAKENSLVISGPKQLVGKKLIKVPEGGDLKITGIFRAVEGTPADTVYIGFRTYDANRREFQHVNVHPVAGTATTVVADAKKGDTFIMVADASKWKNIHSPVWGAKEDLSDLPNYNILPAIDKIEKVGDAWKVTFKKVLPVAIPKDTGVRLHQPGGFMYYTFVTTQNKFANPPRNTTKKAIWPHVKYVRFLVLANWRHNKEAKMEMIDPKVTIIPPAAE
ncbi:MAG: hypothetical protein IKD23_02030 [Lentisphaeria bacterium]|nr:hypothetical protein [Lentisphaeria bacterium]